MSVRGQRLVELSRRFAEVSGDEAIGAIVLPAVQLEVVNEQLWPQMPYRELAPHYDVWLPMAYWTFRTEASGYNDGFTYAEESIRRLRRNLGDPEARVHPIGGIGDLVVADDLRRFATAVDETGSLGASIYDWNTLDDAEARPPRRPLHPLEPPHRRTRDATDPDVGRWRRGFGSGGEGGGDDRNDRLGEVVGHERADAVHEVGERRAARRAASARTCRRPSTRRCRPAGRCRPEGASALPRCAGAPTASAA